MFNEVIFLGKIARLADVCWEGLTLQHVSQKEIVLPYLMFILIAFLFELFLFVLFIVSGFLFFTYNVNPTFEYFICAAILILMICITAPLFMNIIRKQRQ